jgi:hypothetical protein
MTVTASMPELLWGMVHYFTSGRLEDSEDGACDCHNPPPPPPPNPPGSTQNLAF